MEWSFIGMLLILIFLYDMFCLQERYLVGDDSAISIAGHTLSTIESSFYNDLEKIEKWCNINKIFINVVKTKGMVISTKQEQSHFLNRVRSKTVTLMYTSLNEQYNVLENVFKLCSNQHGHPTRSNTSLNLVPHRSKPRCLNGHLSDTVMECFIFNYENSPYSRDSIYKNSFKPVT